jgi:hypothetical protein
MKTRICLLATVTVAWLLSLSDASAFYDPGLQRWINRDPIEETGGLNLFQAQANAPLNFIDAFGFQCFLGGFPYALLAPQPPIPRILIEQAIKLNEGTARVRLPGPRDLDLFSRSGGHFDKATQRWVPNPHVHEPAPPPFAPRFLEWTREATIGEIKEAINQLKSGNSGVGGCGNCNQNSPTLTYPKGMEPKINVKPEQKSSPIFNRGCAIMA